jgi:hypothetical protein
MPARKWILPLVLISVLVFILSLRQLSDPDLGFHLKYGKWIVENIQVPDSDQSTYTVTGHPYVDLHWLFQVVLFGVFIFAGYPEISLFVCLLSMLLFLMLLLRQESLKIPLALIPRLCTNAYYLGNNSFHKTGMGLNRSQLPIQATKFLIDKHLRGRILNSIGFSGWLSWTLPQPIFIDGRLDVMQEQIYSEVTQSWNGRLMCVDGVATVFAKNDHVGALAGFSRAIELNPGFGEAFLGRGTVYFLLRNYQSACKDRESARFLGNVQAARLVELHCNRE